MAEKVAPRLRATFFIRSALETLPGLPDIRIAFFVAQGATGHNGDIRTPSLLQYRWSRLYRLLRRGDQKAISEKNSEYSDFGLF
jgi:hypothetical protein